LRKRAVLGKTLLSLPRTSSSSSGRAMIERETERLGKVTKAEAQKLADPNGAGMVHDRKVASAADSASGLPSAVARHRFPRCGALVG
jgi:hypothetical protein